MNLMANPTITGFRQDVDGTIKELKLGEAKEDAFANIIEQGGADLDDNKAATINVSTYTQPVEITPTSGKDGMKKATVTLSNIPSGEDVSAYAWCQTAGTVSSGATYYFTFTTAPADAAAFIAAVDQSGAGRINTAGTKFSVEEYSVWDEEDFSYTRTSDTEFEIGYEHGPATRRTVTYTRDTTKDFTLWQKTS